MKKSIVLPLLLLLSLVTFGCMNPATSSSVTEPAGRLDPVATTQPASTATRVEYTVTGQADGAPEACRPDDIADRAAAMFDAISRGDLNVVDEYFGKRRDAPFQWYSMTERGTQEADNSHFVAYNLNDLAEYFMQRHEHNERVQLRSIQFNNWDAARGLVHFGPIEMTRQADNLPPGLGGPERLAHGKGAYHCETQAFVVLSVAMTTEQQ